VVTAFKAGSAISVGTDSDASASSATYWLTTDKVAATAAEVHRPNSSWIDLDTGGSATLANGIAPLYYSGHGHAGGYLHSCGLGRACFGRPGDWRLVHLRYGLTPVSNNWHPVRVGLPPGPTLSGSNGRQIRWKKFTWDKRAINESLLIWRAPGKERKL